MLAQAHKHSLLAQAIYLSAANFALHAKEVTDMRHEDIDLKKMVLDSYREKDGVIRVAIVWSETAKAIKAYMSSDEYRRHDEYLFTKSTNKQKLNTGNIVTLNRKLREDASLLSPGRLKPATDGRVKTGQWLFPSYTS